MSNEEKQDLLMSTALIMAMSALQDIAEGHYGDASGLARMAIDRINKCFNQVTEEN